MSKQVISIEQEFRRFEKIRTEIFESSKQASKELAKEIAELIKDKATQGEQCVLGLATGSSPTGVYNELIRLHKDEGLSFKNVVTFNLDEYYPMQPETFQSYVRFMKEYLFDHIDIDVKNIHIPNGTVPKESILEYCQQFEQEIENCGGIDLQILGIGRTGHIGFNEPGSSFNSGTRLINLDYITILDAASDFFQEGNVPRKAITMGVGTIMRSKKIVLIAWGEGKAEIIKKAIEGETTDLIPATFLQNHPDATIYLDQAAADELVRVKSRWLVSTCDWDGDMVRKAVVWLSQKLDKPILKLTDRDYSDNGMGDMVVLFNSAYNINIDIFNQLQHTITGWPGGKPNADDTYRPDRAEPVQKRVVIFSPHPDDDVISMGGTFQRLADQGHEIHVAYQTSGNIAVFDEDVVRYVDFLVDFSDSNGGENKEIRNIYERVSDTLNNKQHGQVDSPEIQRIKTLIRKGEAKSACRYIGLTDDKAHFLEMPFYETGLIKKKPVSETDVEIIVDLLKGIKPHQIYAAGDLSDPHGTHRACLNAIYRALDILKKESWMNECYVWLYRGAWQEWDINDIDMAVPLSPDQVLQKRKAIFKHQSQKDSALFPGADKREFWQRSEFRNKNTAELYNNLGLAEYEAIEAFKRYYF